MIYLTLRELVHVAERAIGGEVAIRDYGLLESAAGRPAASAFGRDAYPDLDAKAALIAFYGVNGRRLILTNDAAYDLIINVAAGQLDSVDDIADILRTATRPRG